MSSFQRKSKPNQTKKNPRRRYRRRAKPPTYDNVNKFHEIQLRNATKKYSELEASIAIRIEQDYDHVDEEIKSHVSDEALKDAWKRFYYWQQENEILGR